MEGFEIPGLSTPAEQRSVEWLDERKGKFTSSEIFKLMTEPRSKAAKDAGELSEGAKTYVKTKLAEQVGGFIPSFDNDSMAWGTQQEYYAKEAYFNITGKRIIDCGFIEHPTMNFFYGGSPDGIIEDLKGCVEIKCPYNHIEHCLIDSPEYFKVNLPNYYYQCISHMILTESEYCVFLSYDPRIKDLGLFQFILPVDYIEVNRVLEKILKAHRYMNTLKQQLQLA